MNRINFFSAITLSLALFMFSCKENSKKVPAQEAVPVVNDSSFKDMLPELNFGPIIDGKPDL